MYGDGISISGNEINVKYGADISTLKDVRLESGDYPITTLGTKEWQFENWYMDQYCTIPMEWESDTDEVLTLKSNLMLYANWLPPEYDVTFNLDGGTWTDTNEEYKQDENGNYILTVDEGYTLQSPARPERYGYEFVGWYYIDNSTGEERELEYIFSESQYVYDNLVLTAKWDASSNISYTVKYVEAQYDGDTLLTDINDYVDPVFLAPDKTVEGQKFGVTVTEDAITIETTGGSFYVPDSAIKSLTLDNHNEEDNCIYFFYTKMKNINYAIYYVKDTGVRYEDGEIPPEDVWLKEPKEDRIIAPADIFIDVTADDIDGYQPVELHQTVLLVSDYEKNVIYFYYRENESKGQYKINFFFMKENNNYEITPDYVAEGELQTGITIYGEDYYDYLEPENELYVGHEYDAELSDEFGIITSSSESTVLNLYFKNIVYNVKYHTQGGTWTDSNPIFTRLDAQTYNLQTTYYYSAEEPTTPTRDGYKFLGWYGVSNGNEFTGNTWNFSEKILSNVDLYAVWIEEENIDITKIWDDGNDRDRIRPPSVTISIDNYGDINLSNANANAENENIWKTQITADKYDYNFDKVVLVYRNALDEDVLYNTITNDNTLTLVGMRIFAKDITINDGDKLQDVLANMKPVEYTAEEQNITEGYDVEYSEDTHTITNVHKPAVTTKIVTKIWNDNNDQDGKRPDSVKLLLKVNGQLNTEVILNEQSGWTYEWKDLYTYEDGKEIEYTVEEAEVPTGYEVSYNQDTLTVTNTHVPETIEKTVTKVWDDNNDQDGKRPDSIDIQLLANGEISEKVTLDGNNNWTYTFRDLDKYKDGQEIEYRIEELSQIDEYTTSYSEDTFTITNTHVPEVINKTATKVWDDNNDQDGKRPDSIELQLFANGEPVGEKVLATKENSYKYTWENIPRYEDGQEIEYTVEETPIDGYTTEYDQETLTITNTHIPEKADKTITKIWRDGNNIEGFRPDSVELQLYANGEPVGEPVTLTEEDATLRSNNWEYTYEDLDVYKDGQKIVYTVDEPEVPEQYGALYDQEKLYVYNAFPPEVNIIVEKVWDDNNDGDKIRPDEIQVQLLADGENYEIDGNNIGLVTLNAENNWTHEFEFLQKYNVDNNAKKYEYTIKEISAVPEYTTTYSENLDENEYRFIITNSYDPKTTQRSVVNVWNDNNDQDGKRPDKLAVNLLANGEFQEKIELTESTGWSYDWESLWLNKEGNEINYTLEVENPEGYTSNVEYDEVSQTFNIETIHIPEKTSIHVSKEWDDNNDQDGLRADEVEIKLLANGQEYDKFTFSDEYGWSTDFNDLDKYKDGVEIVYTVQELKVDGYEISYEREGNNITIINKHTPYVKDLTVTKVWDDDDDRDGIRPTQIEVELLKNGVTKEKVVLTENKGWSHTWEDLDVNEAGEEIEYTIKEISEITDYTTTYNTDDNGNFVITNKHIPYVTERTVTKVWDDAQNQDGKRPQNIRVQLYADGEKYGDEVVLDENNLWTNAWSNLPERESYTTILEDGTVERKIHEIVYTVQEVEVPADYSVSYSNETFTITNTHTPAKIQKQVTVVWNDLENANKTRPEDISINLLANGEVADTIVLNASNNWTYTWGDLDQYEAGKEITYTIENIASIPNYTTSYSDDTFTITNELNKYKYSIEYYYDGVLDPNETIEGFDYFGNVINDYEEKLRDGYRFDRDENTELKITADESKNVMRIYYVKDVFGYTIEYYYDGILNPDETVNGIEEFGTIIDEYEEKLIDGYELKEVVGKPLTISSNESANIMKIYYEKAQYGYTIKYYYDGIEAENERVIDTATYQSVIDTYPDKLINGYKFVEDKNVPLTISSNPDNNIIEVYYVKDEFEYRIEYYYDNVIDADKTVIGKALYESVIDTYDEKLEYGYRKENVENLPLTISYDTSKNIIKVYYVKKDAQVIVNHIDINSNAILDTVTKDGKVGDTYMTESKNIEGYILVRPTENVEVTMTEETITVNYYYVHVSGGVIEKHVDKITGDILYNDLHTGNEGTEYTTSAREFEGYQLVGGIPENAEGEMTIDVIEVTYYYVKEITVNVLYIDDITGETITTATVSGLEGEDFTTEKKQISGYKIIEEKLPTNGSGKLSRDNTEVKYFYIRETRLIVQRIDDKTGLKIVPDEIINGVQDEYYETEGIELTDYVLNEEKLPTNAKGQLKVTKNPDGSVNVDTIVTYYYVHVAGGVIVQHIDENTGDIIEEQVINGLEGDDYNVSEKEILGYELTQKATNNIGKMTVDPIYVQYYYKRKSEVRVQYIDEITGEQILTEDVILGLEGDDYNATEKEVEGYTFVRTKGDSIGQIGASTTTIRHYYKKTTKVIVRYLEDKTEKELATSVEIPGLQNDDYTTEPMEIPYYDLLGLPQNKDGKMEMLEIGDITVVTYYYEKQVFDLKIESNIKDIQINGQSQGSYGDFAKFEIDKDFSNTTVKVIYTIKVSNVGEVPGRVESIIDYIPNGFEFRAEDNDASWKLDSNMVVSDIFKDVVLHPGEEKTIDIVLTWTRSGNNLGEINNVVKIGSYSNVPTFEDVDLDNNMSETTILMAVETGATGNNIIMIIALLAIIEAGVLMERRLRIAGRSKERRIGKRRIKEYLKSDKSKIE